MEQMLERNQPLAQQFGSVQPHEFRERVEQLWAAASRIKDKIVEEVEEGPLGANTGREIIGFSCSKVFGYEPSGQLAQSDLYSALATPTVQQ